MTKNTQNRDLSARNPARKRKLLFYPLIVLVFLLVIYIVLSLSPEEKKEDRTEKVGQLIVDMPDPQSRDIASDKKQAYEDELLHQKQDERLRTLQDYAFSLGKESSENMEDKEFGLIVDSTETEAKPVASAIKPVHPVWTSHFAHENMTREVNSFYQPSGEAERRKLENRIEELSKRLEQAEQANAGNDAEKLMEKSYRMAAKYLNSPSSQVEEKPAAIAVKTDRKHFLTVSNVRENVVTRLEHPVSDSAFMVKYTTDRNWDFHTIAKEDVAAHRNTIRACVLENCLLLFGAGEMPRVPFRLLENVYAGTVLIPCNTVISGDARLEEGRIDVTISSIEYAGNIFPVELVIYDLDGQKGLSAPNAMETSALKEAAAAMTSGLGTSISVSQNAGQQVAMDLTRAATQTGSNYLSRKIRTQKITLKAGYEVLMLSSDK
jgi:conjugative transposon TraM protein